jgi:hypothetical protein
VHDTVLHCRATANHAGTTLPKLNPFYTVWFCNNCGTK